jgi:histidine triad (HIT) family protein
MSTTEPSIFTRIISREIPASIVAETDRLIAFHDIAPKAPVHILVVPKTSEYANVAELATGDPGLLVELVTLAQQIANEHGGEYRLIFNTGKRAGQTIFHVHAHILIGNLGEDPRGDI